jgi:methylmalonyl-CoA carboxyltransferase large subunit
MTSPSDVSQEILSALHNLREEVGQLGQRVAALEALKETQHAAVDEELILTISAAVAAYLGVKPKIRQIRLVSNPQWVQQGRATIQASHGLASRSPH